MINLEEGILTESIKEEILDEFVRVMKNINIYIWCNHKQIPMYLNYFVTKLQCKFDIIIWEKSNAMPLYSNHYIGDKEYCLYFRKNGYCNPTSYEDAKTIHRTKLNVSDKSLYEHPTIKPLPIIETLIRNSSNEGDVILDPFIGSGTTAVACKNLNRNYIGFEIEERWANIAKDRLNGLTKEDRRKKELGQMSLFDFEEKELEE